MGGRLTFLNMLALDMVQIPFLPFHIFDSCHWDSSRWPASRGWLQGKEINKWSLQTLL
jgi:hypothetical protein